MRRYEGTRLCTLLWLCTQLLFMSLNCACGPHVYMYVYDPNEGHRDLAGRLGMHLVQEAIYWDLEHLRRYGDRASHAGWFLAGLRMGPDPRTVVSVMRIVMSFAVWRRRCSRL